MFRFPALEGLPPYLFAELATKKQAAIDAGRNIVDLGLGNPDLPPPPVAIETLRSASAEGTSHGYAFADGSAPLLAAQARYYEHRFGVSLDPRSELLQTIGSKEGFATLARTIAGVGDTALVPDPCYPIHRYGFLMAGAGITPITAAPDDRQLSEVAGLLKGSAKPAAWVLNYPGNPTTQTAELGFYEEAVRLARKHGVLIVSDLAYAELYYTETPPPSIFQVPGAKDIAVEITSVSKTFSMAGWRIGFIAGNAEIIAAVGKVKSYLDYGTFEPLKRAAGAAIDTYQQSCPQLRSRYRARRDAFADGFRQGGGSLQPTDATMFQWLPVPMATRGGSAGFAARALEEAEVVVSPGIGFGPGGDGHVRVALVRDEEVMKESGRKLAALYG